MRYNFKGAKKTPWNATKEVNTKEEKKKKEIAVKIWSIDSLFFVLSHLGGH